MDINKTHLMMKLDYMLKSIDTVLEPKLTQLGGPMRSLKENKNLHLALL